MTTYLTYTEAHKSHKRYISTAVGKLRTSAVNFFLELRHAEHHPNPRLILKRHGRQFALTPVWITKSRRVPTMQVSKHMGAARFAARGGAEPSTNPLKQSQTLRGRQFPVTQANASPAIADNPRTGAKSKGRCTA